MKRITTLAGLSAVAVFSATDVYAATGKITSNEFNPAISLVLDGRYTDISEGEFALPGFQIGGEAGLPENGFSTGENELSISANVDDKFYGFSTIAIVQEEGETEVELEEIYFETLKLGKGFTIKGGQFFSHFGYINQIHDHAQDFADRPLIYDGFFGGHLLDTGVQARWVAPTEQFLQFGAEVTRGDGFPGGENEDSNNGLVFFAKTGGDFSESSSWQLGASYFESDFDVREAGGHGEEEEEGADNELLDGEVDIFGIDFVYKWAPNGNSKNTAFKFIAEYLVRNEEGTSEFAEGDNRVSADYDGEQSGFYAQAIYKFLPGWSAGLRYELLEADNDITNFTVEEGALDFDEFLEESGLGDADDPERFSVMVQWEATHFSRLRLQYNNFDNGLDDTVDSVVLQYTFSLGSHGAHPF